MVVDLAGAGQLPKDLLQLRRGRERDALQPGAVSEGAGADMGHARRDPEAQKACAVFDLQGDQRAAAPESVAQHRIWHRQARELLAAKAVKPMWVTELGMRYTSRMEQQPSRDA